MDKDEDLFDVHKSLAPPEVELKKENDKKKMKVEVYIASGFYEQLLDYSKIKQSKIKNHLIIPQNLKSNIIKHFVELSIQNVKTGYQMNQKNLTSKDIDKLVQEFKDQKLLETQVNSKIELKSKEIAPEEIKQKILYSRVFQPIIYQQKQNYVNISIDNFLVSDQTNNNTQTTRFNRILDMFNFN